MLAAAAYAIKQATNLPIQAQCEPPDDFHWFVKLRANGVDSLGMHLEAWDESVRHRIMPGKAEVPMSYYMEASPPNSPMVPSSRVTHRHRW